LFALKGQQKEARKPSPEGHAKDVGSTDGDAQDLKNELEREPDLNSFIYASRIG